LPVRARLGSCHVAGAAVVGDGLGAATLPDGTASEAPGDPDGADDPPATADDDAGVAVGLALPAGVRDAWSANAAPPTPTTPMASAAIKTGDTVLGDCRITLSLCGDGPSSCAPRRPTRIGRMTLSTACL